MTKHKIMSYSSVISFLNNEPLFPFPSGPLDSKQYSLGIISSKNTNCYQIQYELLSPVEFSVCISRHCKHFDQIFSNKKLKIYNKKENLKNKYVLNINNFIYVWSRIKNCQEEGLATFSYNSIDRDLIDALIRYNHINDNILTFIEGNEKCKKSIIESLKLDKENGKSIELLDNLQMFNILHDNQLEAFYMGIMRSGRFIIADETEKSLSVITIMTYFQKDWPLIIVCNTQRKTYWFEQFESWFPSRHHFKIEIISHFTQMFQYPNDCFDIMIMSYDLYYHIKDELSFKILKFKSFIFEDQSRGLETHSRQWRGLSKCFNNLKFAKRIAFIWSKSVHLNDANHLFPILHILDSITFDNYGKFYEKYCDEDVTNTETKLELELLLRTTVLIKYYNQ